MADTPVTARTTATFTDPGAAHDAAAALERHGFDASAVEVHVAAADTHRRAADRTTWGHLGRRAATGAAGGAVFGALLGVLIAIAADTSIAALAIAGVVAGVLGGALWTAAVAMPVNPGAYDLDGATGPATITATGDPGTATEVLTDAGGTVQNS